MVFSTIIFLCVFLPITIIIYYLLPSKGRNYFLLLASLFFYAWGETKFVWIMIFSIICNYLLGIGIDKAKDIKRASLFLKAGIVINLSILFVFKYLTFTTETLQRLLGENKINIISIALPIGISFYTFQGMSYVIDCYREKKKGNPSIVQKNPFSLALYIAMFPQLIAGPIVRYNEIRKEIDSRSLSANRFSKGAMRFIVGLSKKVILANMMGLLSARIMGEDYALLTVGQAWLGAVAYTLQIYLDFSGYSDMAIGIGHILGFTFPENFNYPYISKSVREFWRRWHMTLSGWFRDYLYIPMGGSRSGNVYLHLFIVFLATGIWHGAAWCFVVWGLWHGLFMLLERAWTKKHPKATSESKVIGISRSIAGWAYTMLVVLLGWVVFGIADLPKALSYIAVMFGANAGKFSAYSIRYYLNNQNIFYVLVSILVCLPYGKQLGMRLRESENKSVKTAFFIAERIAALLLLILCYIFTINSSYNPFIYFRF